MTSGGLSTATSATTTMSSLHAQYLRQVYCSQAEVMQYTRGKRILSVWIWPLAASDEPIAPNLLHKHCQATNTPGPGCLCPLKYHDQAALLESSIALVSLPGSHNGEYAAQCSAMACGYFVPLQRLYLQKAAEFYSKLLTQPEAVSQDSKGKGSQVVGASRALKRGFASLDIESEAYTIALQAPHVRQASETELLLMLDDYSQPGLYDAEFRALLKRMVKCECGMIMTHRVYKEHRCAKALFKPIKRQRFSSNNCKDSQEEGSGACSEDSQGYSGASTENNGSY